MFSAFVLSSNEFDYEVAYFATVLNYACKIFIADATDSKISKHAGRSIAGATTLSIMTLGIITLRLYDTQYNDTQHNGTQHDDTQHNDIQ